MQQRLGDEFDGLIVSVTKFGLFVELNELFIEGLVPLSTMTDDRYTYHENTRQIIGQRNRQRPTPSATACAFWWTASIRMQKRIQFALVEERPVPKRLKKKKKK